MTVICGDDYEYYVRKITFISGSNYDAKQKGKHISIQYRVGVWEGPNVQQKVPFSHVRTAATDWVWECDG